MLIDKAFNFKRMKTILISLLLLNLITTGHAQRGYNYYKDSVINGSPNEKAFAY